MCGTAYSSLTRRQPVWVGIDLVLFVCRLLMPRGSKESSVTRRILNLVSCNTINTKPGDRYSFVRALPLKALP